MRRHFRWRLEGQFPHPIQLHTDLWAEWDIKSMFSIDGSLKPPHFVTGNKMWFEKVVDLLDFLFLWEDDEERLG